MPNDALQIESKSPRLLDPVTVPTLDNIRQTTNNWIQITDPNVLPNIARTNGHGFMTDLIDLGNVSFEMSNLKTFQNH
jgi:hypothetical protein